MFDVGFSELVVIALVGLIVIGPERMPKVARTIGHLLGRFQRYVGDVKADINREMRLEELKKMQSQVVEQARDMERQVSEQMKTVETSLNQSILSSGDGAVAAASPDPATPPIASAAPPASPPPAV